jgi:hypothetical protein
LPRQAVPGVSQARRSIADHLCTAIETNSSPAAAQSYRSRPPFECLDLDMDLTVNLLDLLDICHLLIATSERATNDESTEDQVAARRPRILTSVVVNSLPHVKTARGGTGYGCVRGVTVNGPIPLSCLHPLRRHDHHICGCRWVSANQTGQVWVNQRVRRQ